MKHSYFTSIIFFAALSATSGEFSFNGELGSENRFFRNDGDESSTDINSAAKARIELGAKQENFREKLKLLGRVDFIEKQRKQLILEEAWVEYRKRDLQISAGAKILNWSNSEAFYPSDFINSRNTDGNIENPEKLGEPMLAIEHRVGHGKLSLYYLPLFVEPLFPRNSSRLNPLPSQFKVLPSQVLKENGTLSNSNQVHQYGFRVTQTVGKADFSAYWLRHIDKQSPSFQLNPMTFEVQPIFQMVDQFGFGYVQVLGPVLFKSDLSTKVYPNQSLGVPNHTTVASGIEYTKNIGSASHTLIFEGQSIFGTSSLTRSQLNLFQRDLMLGYRLSWDLPSSPQVLTYLIWDLEKRSEYLINLKYSQRLWESWTFELGAKKIFAPPSNGTSLEYLHKSDMGFFNLNFHF